MKIEEGNKDEAYNKTLQVHHVIYDTLVSK
jgi:hypothetical protein